MLTESSSLKGNRALLLDFWVLDLSEDLAETLVNISSNVLGWRDKIVQYFCDFEPSDFSPLYRKIEINPEIS